MKIRNTLAVTTAGLAAASLLAITPGVAHACGSGVAVEGKTVQEPVVIGNDLPVQVVYVNVRDEGSIWFYLETNGRRNLQRGFGDDHPARAAGLDNGFYGEDCRDRGTPDTLIL